MNFKSRDIAYTGVNTRVLYEAPNGRVFTSLEELDKEYDIDASVPDFMAIAGQFIGKSESAREKLDCQLDIPYGPTIAETLDVFPGKPGGPVVVFIHGGYWRMLTSKEFNFVALGLVARGATVVIPTYALTPAVSMNEIVRQHRAALAWTYRNIAEFGADPNRIVVTGHSAGGHGVASVLQTDWENEYGLPADMIKGAMAISGLFDLRPLPYTFVQPSLQLNWDQVLRNSPILNLPKSAPHLIVTRGDDQTSEFLRQSDDFYTAWKEAGLPGEHWARPDFNHFDELFAFEDPESELIDKIMKLTDNK